VATDICTVYIHQTRPRKLQGNCMYN